MPDRTFVIVTEPPTIRDRVKAHLAEISIATSGVIKTMVSIGSNWDKRMSPTLEWYPPFVTTPIAVIMLIGSIMWLYVIIHRFESLNRYWFYLRWALSASGFAWFSYWIISITSSPMSIGNWSYPFLFTIVTWTLYWISFSQEKVIRSRGK